jgi:hypothetical protein
VMRRLEKQARRQEIRVPAALRPPTHLHCHQLYRVVSQGLDAGQDIVCRRGRKAARGTDGPWAAARDTRQKEAWGGVGSWGQGKPPCPCGLTYTAQPPSQHSLQLRSEHHFAATAAGRAMLRGQSGAQQWTTVAAVQPARRLLSPHLIHRSSNGRAGLGLTYRLPYIPLHPPPTTHHAPLQLFSL